MLTSPSAERSDANLCLLAFMRWANSEVEHPPRVTILSGGILQPDFKSAGVRVIDDPPSTLRSAERALRRRGKLKAAKAARMALHASVFRRPPQPRCILACTIHGAGPALRFMPRETRLVIYAYETGDILDQLVNAAMMGRLVAGTRTWVAASDSVAAGLEERGVAPERIMRCDPFIEPPTTHPPEVKRAVERLDLRPDELVVGGVGRSDWRDAPDVFLRVAALTKRRWPELKLRFVWVGAPDDGPTRWILDHDIRHAGLSDTVTLIGDLTETETWLSTFDILALTSRVDPPPHAGLEAGALGVPVVAFDTRRHSNASLLSSDLGAVVVPYLDVEAMATRVAELASNGAVRQEIAAQGIQNVRSRGLVKNRAEQLWDLLERTAVDKP